MFRRLIFKRKGGSLVQKVWRREREERNKKYSRLKQMNRKKVSLVRIEIQKR